VAEVDLPAEPVAAAAVVAAENRVPASREPDLEFELLSADLELEAELKAAAELEAAGRDEAAAEGAGRVH
jgi:hypothetical protein